MKKNILKATLVAAFAFFAGVNVYNSQKSDVLSDLALDNVEALASGSEGSGIPQKGLYTDWNKGCCKSGHWNDECSTTFPSC